MITPENPEPVAATTAPPVIMWKERSVLLTPEQDEALEKGYTAMVADYKVKGRPIPTMMEFHQHLLRVALELQARLEKTREQRSRIVHTAGEIAAARFRR